jgi:hypothetical protein
MHAIYTHARKHTYTHTCNIHTLLTEILMWASICRHQWAQCMTVLAVQVVHSIWAAGIRPLFKHNCFFILLCQSVINDVILHMFMYIFAHMYAYRCLPSCVYTCVLTGACVCYMHSIENYNMQQNDAFCMYVHEHSLVCMCVYLFAHMFAYGCLPSCVYMCVLIGACVCYMHSIENYSIQQNDTFCMYVCQNSLVCMCVY